MSSIDRLIEIGAVVDEGFQEIEQDIFQTYVNLNRQISREISELTSITDEKVKDAPHAIESIRGFFGFVETFAVACLIGHYVSFDALVS